MIIRRCSTRVLRSHISAGPGTGDGVDMGRIFVFWAADGFILFLMRPASDHGAGFVLFSVLVSESSIDSTDPSRV